MKSVEAVIVLTPGFTANEQDTASMPYMQDFASSFSRLYPNIKLLVIAFQYPKKRGSYFWNGIEVYCAGGRDKRYFSRILTWLRVMRQIRFYKKKYSTTVLHSFWLTECTLVGQWASNLFSMKHIAYAAGQDVTPQNRYLKLISFKKNNFVAMSQFIADRLQKTNGYKIETIIPFGVNEENLVLNHPAKTIDILGVGALIPLKNYSLFIDIINQLKSDFPHLISYIVGRGEQKELLEQLIKKYSLENNMVLTGELPHTEIFNYMAKSKIFLHTSNYEGQSTVINEALAVGLPVVCFDVGRLHSDKKITVCADENEMIAKLKELLVSEIDYTALVLQKMDDTVRSFMKLYES